MRLVQVMIPAGKREAIQDLLEREGIDFVVTDETSGREYTGVVYFPLPPNAVEPVLEKLDDLGLGETYTVVLDAETVVSRKFDQLVKEYEESEESDERIARQEVVAQARELMPDEPTYLVLSAVSAVVAAAGLLLDSPAVVVGSMVIAPILGPAMATSVGTVTNDRPLFAGGVKFQAAGFAVAVLAAVAFSFVARLFYIVPPGVDVATIPQIEGRLSPGFLELAVALGAGIAGALSLSAGISAALVGVMIAAALIPPTAAIGIGIVWGDPLVVAGSTLLVLVNALSINLAALATLWLVGYRPDSWWAEGRARKETLRRIAVLAASILVLSAFLGGVTFTTYERATFEQTANEQVTTVLGSPEYEGLTLLDTSIAYQGQFPIRRSAKIVLTVGRPAGEPYPGLASRIERRISQRAQRPVSVEVRFVEVQQSG